MPDHESPLGTLVQLADGRRALRYVRRYPHPPERVWKALVEHDGLSAWFPARIEGERRQGAALRFVFEGNEGPVLEGVMRVFEPPRVLEYTWDTDLLRFELKPEAGGQHCELTFTTTFGQRSHAARDASGWHMCLTNLDKLLSASARKAVEEHFPSLYKAYVASLGLGEFPSFLQSPSPEGIAELLPAPGLQGQLFSSAAGPRLGLLRATEDTRIREHELPVEGAYLCVLEGTFTLHIGPNVLPLSAGMEFHVPGGGVVSGELTAGTRILYARSDSKAR